MVTCCKTLIKASDESIKSMVSSETEPCSTLDVNKFLKKVLYCQDLLDFQDLIGDHLRNKKHQYSEIGYF